MKKIILMTLTTISLLFLFSCSKKTTEGLNETTNTGAFRLVWSDEFDGTAINTNNWSYQVVDSSNSFNNELQSYTNSSDNAYIQDGNMVIEAKYNGNGIAKGNFTSARMITHGKQKFRYGKISARIQVPYGQGIWPAFWMLGSNINENQGGTVPWPRCGEIDIMEKIGGGGNEKVVHGTLHYLNDTLGYNPAPTGSKTLTANLSDDFHVYEIEWGANTMIWKFDGTEYNRIDISSSDFNEFREDFYILLNLAVGGNWPGSPNTNTVFPQKMLIDWVRVYQK